MKAESSLTAPSWDLTIKPRRSWLDLPLGDLWRYRDLVFLLTKRDFNTAYKQTILGPLWFVIQPIVSTIVFTVIFSNIAGITTGGIPPFLFYLSGTICWGYFGGCFRGTSDTFVNNAGIFGKVYFPRLVVPVATVISALIHFLTQFVVFLVFYFWFYFHGTELTPSWLIFFLPLLILQMALLGLGCGMCVSALTTKYRDLSYLMHFGVQLWMYATPVVYPLSQVPESYRWLYGFNPMTSVVEGFRQMFTGQSNLPGEFIILSLLITLFILMLGLLIFHRVEKNFIDTV